MPAPSQQICRHLKQCPGCPQFSANYAEQLALKNKLFASSAQPLVAQWQATTKLEIADINPSPAPLRYRFTSKFVLQKSGTKLRLGLFAENSHLVVDLKDCLVLDQDLQDLLDHSFGERNLPPFPVYDHNQKRFQHGALKYVTVRKNIGVDSLTLIISHTGCENKALQEYFGALCSKLPHVSVFASELQAKDGNQIFGAEAKWLCGPKEISANILGTTFQLTPLAFFQANGLLLEQMIAAVHSFFATSQLPKASRTLVDFYSGFGAFSLTQHDRFSKIILADNAPASITAARTTISALKLQHCQASVATVEDMLSNRISAADKQSVTHMIVNPPRAGMSEKALRALTRHNFPKLERFAYVSCNPEALLRDLQVLHKNLHPKTCMLKPFDMFPQTRHLETLAFLCL